MARSSSAICPDVPSSRINCPTWVITLPLLLSCDSWLVSSKARIPYSVRLLSSLLCAIPSLLMSCHNRTSENCASCASNWPSRLLSKSRRASKPLLANVPSCLTVSVPNNSWPLLINPSLLRSNTSNASSWPTQPVPVLTPSPSKSNRSVPLLARVSIPSPSKSTISGSV